MKAALDTNILIYAYADDPRTDVARELLLKGGRVSVQALNEFANVARRKLGLSWEEIEIAVADIVMLCGDPVPLDLDVHLAGRAYAERYTLSLYDGLMIAAAVQADCDVLYSEDMHDGLVVADRLRIVNPFALSV